ncbi:MAG TPA: TraR/DksA C4-type zinc finger protein [Candidatus Kapabacteria bacterium]|nr:TraR/DksA C4-type zinc finger protein [Candidatus Kapabacteria bacterium]
MAKKKEDVEEKVEAKTKKAKVEVTDDIKSEKKVKSTSAKISSETKEKSDSPTKSKKKGETIIEEPQQKPAKEESREVVAPFVEPSAVAKSTPPNEANRPAINPDVRYSDEELDEFAVLIAHEKDNALEELRMLKERLDDLTSFDAADESMIYSMHMAEQGSEAQEKEKTYAQIQRIHEYIKKLEDAVERIKNKTYGICRVCGCLIAKARLRAVPITTLSASYKIHQKCPEDGIDKIEPLKK